MKFIKFAVFTVFTVIITALALTSCGDGKYDSQGLCYEENSDGSYSVSVGRAKELTVLTVPATFEGKAVTRIAAGGFKENGTLTAVYLPEGLLSIGKQAFA